VNRDGLARGHPNEAVRRRGALKNGLARRRRHFVEREAQLGADRPTCDSTHTFTSSTSTETRRTPGIVHRQRARGAGCRRDKLDTEVVTVPVPESARSCTACGSDAFKTVGNGTPSVIYDDVAPHFRRRIYRRETFACRCGSSIVTAPCPEKVFDRSQYPPGFVAYLIVAQCADAIGEFNRPLQHLHGSTVRHTWGC